MNQENWVPVPNYSNYLIEPTLAQIKGKRGTPRKLYPRSKYPALALVNDEGILKWEQFHRLMAITFLENPENKPLVIHLDGDKTNFSLDNLKWCTYAEKARYYQSRKKPSRNRSKQPVVFIHQEEWRDIEGYSQYQVSNFARVKRKKEYKEDGTLKRDEYLVSDPEMPEISDSGYVHVVLDGKVNFVHRLVAVAFIPNPNNESSVNHIDGNKINNSLDNLEWVSYANNMRKFFAARKEQKELENS